MNTNVTPKLWGVMPAAGSGTRMGLDFPKQYLHVAGKTIIEHSIDLMLSLDNLERLVVCVAANDQDFQALSFNDTRVSSAIGGATRADSVLKGLLSLNEVANESDWVLVHDAARPCLELTVLRQLIESVSADPVGGILALEARDTLKLAVPSENDNDRIQSTLDRSRVWQAQTPQMFRYQLLLDSLSYCLEKGLTVTDEASSLEHKGHSVKLVRGSATNIKVTNPEDQRLAEILLSS